MTLQTDSPRPVSAHGCCQDRGAGLSQQAACLPTVPDPQASLQPSSTRQEEAEGVTDCGTQGGEGMSKAVITGTQAPLFPGWAPYTAAQVLFGDWRPSFPGLGDSVGQHRGNVTSASDWSLASGFHKAQPLGSVQK